MSDPLSSNSTLAIPFPTVENFKIQHDAAKRFFDILFSSLILILGLPIFFLIALIVRFSSKGWVIYSQERVGRGGRPFKCYKFRSMYPDADTRLKELLNNSPMLQEEWDKNHKLKNDPRVTPIGRFLRKTSLDELPQFWNVLKGDLSIVGPRPVVKAEIQKHFKEKALFIFSIRPGLTGLWQVSGRSNTSYEERIKMDEEYVRTRSFLLDLKLVFLTIPALFFSKGAY